MAFYARVSTTEQDESLQVDAMRRWAEYQGVEFNKHNLFVDKYTGTTIDRPGFNELMHLAREHRCYDRLVIWRIDRLGRSIRQVPPLFDEFDELGIKLVSIQDNLDLGTPMGEAMAGILLVFAQYENSLRSDRVRSGIRAKRDEARRLGKTYNFGGSKSRYTPRVAAAIGRVRELIRQGHSNVSIADQTDVSRETVRRERIKMKKRRERVKD